MKPKQPIGLEPGDYLGTYAADAGHLALDFTNTLSNRLADHPHEWLDGPSNLVAWGELTDIAAQEMGETMRVEAEAKPDEAARSLTRAIALRETIYRVFSAVASGQEPPPDDTGSLNAFLSAAMVHLRIVQEENGFGWAWDAEKGTLDRIIWPVIRAAAVLLTSESLDRVGECQGDGCGWLFLDTSRNRSRRWCSMAECGNRAKARRHYARIREV
jgi:predicted RNA-binding Zn ribbon-like protein